MNEVKCCLLPFLDECDEHHLHPEAQLEQVVNLETERVLVLWIGIPHRWHVKKVVTVIVLDESPYPDGCVVRELPPTTHVLLAPSL